MYVYITTVCHWCNAPQEVFKRDEGNYTAHVFAGVASLELHRGKEARGHYKAAIEAQPEEPLAWKVPHYKITAGHWPFSEQISKVATQNLDQLEGVPQQELKLQSDIF